MEVDQGCWVHEERPRLPDAFSEGAVVLLRVRLHHELAADGADDGAQDDEALGGAVRRGQKGPRRPIGVE